MTSGMRPELMLQIGIRSRNFWYLLISEEKRMGLKEFEFLSSGSVLCKNTTKKFVESFNRRKIDSLYNILGRSSRCPPQAGVARQKRLYLTNKPLKSIRLQVFYLPTVTNISWAHINSVLAFNRNLKLCYFVYSESLNYIDFCARWWISQMRSNINVPFRLGFLYRLSGLSLPGS